MDDPAVKVQTEDPGGDQNQPEQLSSAPGWVTRGVYAVALAGSIAIWFIALRSPLWLDETGSYWQIKDGLSKIWGRQFITLAFPAYAYLLGLSTKIIGTSEAALRTPSVLAMLGAVYLFYLIAREFFDREIALIATVIFCVNPIVIFTAIDARPYAFAVLATNAAILIALRLRKSDSTGLAVLLGLVAACILYFHYLFAVIVPALAVCLLVARGSDRKVAWKQFGIAAAVFAVACLPLIPGLRYLFGTSASHVFEPPPTLGDLAWTFAPGWLPFIFTGVALVALVVAATRKSRHYSPEHVDRTQILLCALLALIPVLLLFGVSRATSVVIFAARYRLVAVPGIVLCWALLIRLFSSHAARLVFCAALVAGTAFTYLHTPFLREHADTWKYALAAADRDASRDNAPVLVYCPFIEGDFIAMPKDSASAKEDRYFSPLSYYKVSVPVVAMPYSLRNDETARRGSQFLQEAAQKRERFLAMGDMPAYTALDWLARHASGAYVVRELGVFDQTKVLEFTPRTNNEAK